MESTLEKIYKSSLKFLIPLNLEETYELIIKESMELVGADHGSLFLKKGRKLERIYASSSDFYQIKNRPRGSMYQAFKENKIKVLNVPYLTKLHPVLRRMKVHSIIAAPLSYKRVSIGVIALQSKKPNRFKNKAPSILRLFTPLVTLALRKTQLYEEVRKALETRDLFISMAAHELRTPLTAVSGYIQLLHRRLGGKDTTESRWMEQLSHESLRLSSLVNELLEINRIKSGQLKYFLTECHLIEIIERVKNDFGFSYPNRNIVIENRLKNESDAVIGDYTKIIQVISNLVDNAIKFSPNNSPVKIVLSSKKSYLSVSIQDQGIGINKKDLPRLMEGFQQGEGHNKEGMGLGLFLVQDIVTVLQGELKIRSKVNQGTKVEVSFPKFKYASRNN